jgi:hypothetical protein
LVILFGLFQLWYKFIIPLELCGRCKNFISGIIGERTKIKFLIGTGRKLPSAAYVVGVIQIEYICTEKNQKMDIFGIVGNKTFVDADTKMPELKDLKSYVGKIRIEYDADISIEAFDFEGAYDAAMDGIKKYLRTLNASNTRGMLISLERVPIYYDHLLYCSGDRHKPPSECSVCKKFVKEDGTIDIEKAYGDTK